MTRRVLLACTLVVCALYFARLSDTPVAMGGDEALTAIHGLALAQTGRDLNGRTLPLLIQVDPDMDPGLWWQPFLIYLEAAAFLVLPFAEWSARLPVAVLAVISIALTGMAAARYTSGGSAAVVAALVLATSPIFFFMSRQALDYMCPVVFVAGWLYLVARLHHHGSPRVAFACGAVLGVGLLSHISAWMMMPLYLLCTLAVAVMQPDRRRLCAAAAMGFALPAAALIAALLAQPGAGASLFNRYAGGSAQLPGLNINTYYRAVDLVSAYWMSWNPAQLFLVGSSNPVVGMRTAGVFVAPAAILFGAGLLSLRARTLDLLLLTGLLLAPLGPVLHGTPGAIQRQLVLLPFVAVVSARGAEWLWSRRAATARGGATLAVVASLAWFAYTAYTVFAGRADYAVRFDPSNFRELTPALAALDRQLDAPQVVLAIGPYDRRAYWHFHTNVLGEHTLRDKAVFWEPEAFQSAAVRPNSLIVASAPSPLADRLDRHCGRVARFKGDAEVVVWRANDAGCAERR